MSSNPPRADPVPGSEAANDADRADRFDKLLAASIDLLGLNEKTIALKVHSWRQFLHGTRRASQEDHADDDRIELRCRFQQQDLLEAEIIVGENSIRYLSFTIEIRSAQKFFADDFERTNPDPEVEGKDAVGFLFYHRPIQAQSDGPSVVPGSVIEEFKTGSVAGWVYFGIETVREISRLLTLQPEQDIHIGLTVNAPPTASPNSLTYEGEFPPTRYRWDGKPLKIVKAVVAVDKPPLVTPEKSPERNEPGELHDGPLLRRIANSIDKLNTNVGRFGIYILVALGLILIELWRQHG